MLKREVNRARDPSPECVHFDPVRPWAVLLLIVGICGMVGAFCYAQGHGAGYDDGFRHGGFYKTCKGDYNG